MLKIIVTEGGKIVKKHFYFHDVGLGKATKGQE